MRRKFRTGPDDNPDVRESRFSDEDMGRYAEDALEASGLPRDRLAVVTREVLSFRDIARIESIHGAWYNRPTSASTPSASDRSWPPGLPCSTARR